MKKRFSKVMLVVLFLSVLTLVVMVTPLVKAQGVSLSPTSGPVGSSVTVTVSGFTAGDTVIVDLAGSNFPSYELGVIQIGSAGSGTKTFTIPSYQNPEYGVTYNVNPGVYTITASGTTYTSSGSASFTVTTSTSATATPTSAPSASASPRPTSTPKIPEFSTATLTLIVAAMAATTLCAAAYSKKRRRI